MRTALRLSQIAALPFLVLACGGDDQPMQPVPGNNAPTAVISANPASVPAGDGNMTVVTLDGTGSTDPDGDSLSYAWTVANGTFVNGTTASSATAEVTFPGTGAYAVTLTVNDGNGGSNTASTTIPLTP
ncbi:MAG: PKD domain-containing protein [Gemmatimonadota bacterium]